MLHKNIYLIGHINPSHKETYDWRDEVVENFKDRADINIINPCDSGFDVGLLHDGKEDPERLAAYRKKGVRLLVPKSLQSVKQSTMAIANLNMFGSVAPMIGTLYELSWYLEHPSKAVIGIYTDGIVSTDPYCAHPFVAESVHVWTKSVKEACKMVDMF
jgi:hypothetical protein